MNDFNFPYDFPFFMPSLRQLPTRELADRDGIYLNKIWVAPSTGIATTYQSNDLSKPATLQTNYSNTFNLPDTIAVRRLTENAEQLDSGSKYPYKTLSATVIDNGETVFIGVAELSEFSSGWKVVLYEEKRNLFERLSRSIRTADLSAFDHDWTVENINARINATYGVCYPLIDYGLLSANVLPLDTVYPAVFVSTIVRQMLKQEGYTLVGDLPSDPIFKRLAIPFSEQEGVNHDEKWVNERKARVTQNNVEYATKRTAFDSGRVMDRIQPFNIDDRPAEGWQQGIMRNYNPANYTYVCDTSMRVRVNAFQMVKALATAGAVEFLLIVEKNGNNVHQEYFEAVGVYNPLYLKTDKLEINEVIDCQKGDRLQIRFICRRRTNIGAFSVTIYNDPDSSWVAFTPDITLRTGDFWPVARNLPDLTGTSLLVSIAQILGGTWSVDARRRQIKFVSLSKTIANTENAADWSNKLDTGTEPGWTPRLEPYAQRNYLKWQETDESKATDGGPNYGDGVIEIAADSLETETDLFILPFAASTLSTSEVSGYGNPIYVKTRTVSGFGSNNATINRQSARPRLILVSIDGENASVGSKRFKPDGLTIEDVTLNLKPCWFGPRPNAAINPNSAFSLCFSPVKDMKGEVCLIDRNYTGLKRVLRRMRALTVSVTLRPEDIATLDFGRPIRLRRVEIGSSLILSDGFYYLNSVNSYQPNGPCKVRLIAY